MTEYIEYFRRTGQYLRNMERSLLVPHAVAGFKAKARAYFERIKPERSMFG